MRVVGKPPTPVAPREGQLGAILEEPLRGTGLGVRSFPFFK